MTTAIDFFRPSSLSAVGLALEDAYEDEVNIRSWPQLPAWQKTMHRVSWCLSVWYAALQDLGSWLWATVTVRRAWQIGFWNHAANLTSTMAICVLALGIPFGYRPQMAFLRPHYSGIRIDKLANPFQRLMYNRGPEERKTELRKLISRHLENPIGAKVLKAALEYFHRGGNIFTTPDYTLAEFVEVLVQTCLDQRKPEVLSELRSTLPSLEKMLRKKIFRSELLLFGFDLNTQDSFGRTFFMHAIRSCDAYGIRDFFAWSKKVDPRLGIQPIDVRLQSPGGFDVFSLALLGLGPSRNRGGYCFSSYVLPSGRDAEAADPGIVNEYLHLLKTLIANGAFLETEKIREYRGFLQNVQPFVENSALVGGEFAWEAGIRKNNPYISPIAAGITSTALRRDDLRDLLNHANLLVTLEPQLEVLWEPYRVLYLHQYRQHVSAGFREHEQGGFFTNETEGRGADIITEYLMSEAPILSQNPT